MYSLAIRIVRICSQEADRDKRLEELADRLRQRKYREEVIIAGIAKAKAVQRGDALKKVMKEQQEVTRQHRLIVEYDRRSSPPVRDILESNYMGMVARDKRMGKTFPSIPRPTFAKGKSIQNMLCRAKLPPAKQVSTRAAAGASRSGLTRCNKGLARAGCMACPFVTATPNQVIKSVTITSTKEEIPVEGRITCSTKNFLYMLWSSKDPESQYCGSSGREVRTRCGEHRRDISNKVVSKAVPAHFYSTGSGVKDLVMVPFKRVFSDDPAVSLLFEHEAINKHMLLEKGINRIL